MNFCVKSPACSFSGGLKKATEFICGSLLTFLALKGDERRRGGGG